MQSYRVITALIAMSVLAGPSLAANAPLTLAEAQRRAVERSLQVVAQDAAVTASRHMAVAAAQLPDPMLRAGIDNLPVTGPDKFSLGNDFMTMRRIGVMQELTRGEKRRLRSERFTLEAEKSLAEKTGTIAQIQRDTALAWLDRYYAEQMRVVLDQMVQDTQALIGAAEAAYRGGRGSQADVLTARAALIGLEDRRSQLDRQLRTAKIALARWIGPEAERALQGPPPDFGILSLDIARLDEELQHHPVLGALAQQVALAETEVRLARTATQPDWSVELAYQQRGPSFSNMVSIGVSIPLPIAPAERQDRDVAAKLAMAEQARAQFDDALRMHTAEVRAMIAEWETGRDRLRRIETELMSLAAQRSDAALAAYRGNTGTLSAVLEARRNESDTRVQALQLAADTARVWAQLNFLVPKHESSNTSVDAGRRSK